MHSIGRVLDYPFLSNRSSFIGQTMQPIESGGQRLILRRMIEQVAGYLPCYELIVRQIRIERTHSPVSIRQLSVKLVGLITVRIGIPRRVEPAHCHVLAE